MFLFYFCCYFLEGTLRFSLAVLWFFYYWLFWLFAIVFFGGLAGDKGATGLKCITYSLRKWLNNLASFSVCINLITSLRCWSHSLGWKCCSDFCLLTIYYTCGLISVLLACSMLVYCLSNRASSMRSVTCLCVSRSHVSGNKLWVIKSIVLCSTCLHLSLLLCS